MVNGRGTDTLAPAQVKRAKPRTRATRASGREADRECPVPAAASPFAGRETPSPVIAIIAPPPPACRLGRKHSKPPHSRVPVISLSMNQTPRIDFFGVSQLFLDSPNPSQYMGSALQSSTFGSADCWTCKIERGRSGGLTHRPPCLRMGQKRDIAFRLHGDRDTRGHRNAIFFRRARSSPPRRTRMNALSNPKCTRLLVAFGLCLILAAPAMLLWASRAQLSPIGDEEDAFIAKLMQMDARQMDKLQLPPATLRPAEFAVFGDDFKTARRVDGDANGLLRTNLADIDPKNAEAALRGLPAELKFGADEVTRLGARGHLTHGLNYIMLSPEAIAAKSLDAVLDGVRRDIRTIVDYRANSTLLAYVEAGQIGRLRQEPGGGVYVALPPADKIELQAGRRPLINKERALGPTFLLEVAIVPGGNGRSVKDRLAKVPGVVDVADYGLEGSAYLVRADHKALGRLARVPDVLHIQEYLELMQMNTRIPA